MQVPSVPFQDDEAYAQRRCLIPGFTPRVVSDRSRCADSPDVPVCRRLAQLPNKTYEFPDGNSAAFGLDRFRLGEVLFQPAKFYDVNLVRARRPPCPSMPPPPRAAPRRRR